MAAGPVRRRAPLALKGRYLLADGSEFPCLTTDVSPAGLGILGERVAAVGSKVIAYIDDYGRVEGTVVRRGAGWFALSFAAHRDKRERLASRIGQLKFDRGVLSGGIDILVRRADGSVFPGSLDEVSGAGAGLSVAGRFAIGERLWVGDCEAEVVRGTESGVGVRFV